MFVNCNNKTVMAPIVMNASNGLAENGKFSSTQNSNEPSHTITPCPLKAPLVVTIVGLPCRGKSMAAKRIARHLTWRGEYPKVIRVDVNAKTDTLTEIMNWFQSGNNVAIVDGMHLTRQTRQFLTTFCNEKIFHHLFVEFDCDEKSLEDNIRETALFYKNLDSTMDWVQIFRDKLVHCSDQYEICKPAIEGPMITITNSENPLVHSVTARGVQGYLQTMILGVLSMPVIKHQLYYFTRHGESEYNVLGRIGGDADLSSRGRSYADLLTKYLTGGTSSGAIPPKLIWTSELCRTIHTVEKIPGPRAAIRDLNEINAGICEGLTYEEIHERFPQEFAWRDQDKLKYRYPHGESYLDLLQRVDSIVQALLPKTDVLVVSHQAVLRCIMAYFMGSTPEEVPYINVPLHTLLAVRSYGYEFQVETIPLQVKCVDTFRQQPKNCSPERSEADVLETVPAHFDAIVPHLIN
ncbi:6-phosphofructo-2-kinase/fructose-2,6-bisphosphatase-like isoform X1 [Bradysia coprophila]|uniref:6-phosphofructo-2-kinase/fructose-2, 6-bisphosphatase-like isoform X1 n=1 Tax=Bradysia coprophila TaxID=38358 RepID=UPI00187DC286|nr:6-phosphofructo-2-kinase/fructose-2,6-bisphosphatase-like isoform X1 [Bradysia coprophila]